MHMIKEECALKLNLFFNCPINMLFTLKKTFTDKKNWRFLKSMLNLEVSFPRNLYRLRKLID